MLIPLRCRPVLCALAGMLLGASGAVGQARFSSLGRFPSGTFSRVEGLSGDGTTVVGWGDISGRDQAFRWRIGQPLTPLPGTPGNVATRARLPSFNGDVCVVEGSSNYPSRWTARGGGRLNAMPIGFSYPSWTPGGISDNGKTIAGVTNVGSPPVLWKHGSGTGSCPPSGQLRGEGSLRTEGR